MYLLLPLLCVNWSALEANWNSTFCKLHFIFKLAPSVVGLLCSKIAQYICKFRHTSFQQFYSCLKSNCASAKLYKQLQICFPPHSLYVRWHFLCYLLWLAPSVGERGRGEGVDKVEPIIMGALSFAFSDRFRLSCCTFAVTEIFLSRLQPTHRER